VRFIGDGKIEAAFQIHDTNENYQYNVLVFDLRVFISAFNELTFQVDF